MLFDFYMQGFVCFYRNKNFQSYFNQEIQRMAKDIKKTVFAAGNQFLNRGFI